MKRYQQLTGGGRHSLGLVLGLAAPLLLAGCLPGDGSQERSSDRRSASATHVNRAEKRDLFPADPASSRERKQGRNTLAEGGTRVAALDPGTSDALVEPVPLATGTALVGFYQALDALARGERTRPVTIIHLGDSHIAADRFSGDLRVQFQSRFGNAGRGMMMPGLFLARGVKFERGGQWTIANSVAGDPGPFSLTGVRMTARSPDAWLRLTATDRPFDWSEITLETGPGLGTAVVTIDGEPREVSTAGTAQSWQSIRLTRAGREIVLRSRRDGPVTLLSWAIGNDRPGVHYVNLGLPEATVLTPQRWDQVFVRADLKRLAPDLIVLGYGSQEALDDQLDIADYGRAVAALLAALSQAAPQASMLVIGPPDAARLPPFARLSGAVSEACRALSAGERDSYPRRLAAKDQRLARWHPPLNLASVRTALRRAAAVHGAYYWDWSRIMGGPCGIHAWVHAQPPLAASDHRHLTDEGSRRSARLLFRELMDGYDAFARTAAR